MNRNILNLRQLTVLLILCTAFLGGIIPAFAQQGGKKITGQVIDENKEPMIGVSILIVGTSTGTVTDFDGNYTLNVPQGNKELQFIIRKSKFPLNPERSVQISGKRTKRSVQKKAAHNTYKAGTKG